MSTRGYKCPCCGGSLVFSSDTQKLQCPSCDHEIDMETVRQYAEIVESVEAQGDTFEWGDDAGESQTEWGVKDEEGRKLYICPCCGAEVDADETTASTTCLYCDSPVILPGQVSGEYHPDLIIPFQMDEEGVKEIFKEYCKGKKFLPKAFRSGRKIQEVTGSYVPVWLFSCRAKGTFIYDAQKIKKWQDDDFEYTQRDLYLVTRKGDMFFEYLPVGGSSEKDESYMESIEPYGIEKAVPFEEGYLSGYEAIRYDVSKEECRNVAEEKIKSSLQRAMSKSVNHNEYYSIFQKSSSIACTKGKVQYALLPLWTFHVKYKDKIYPFAVNGQTGKLSGDLPTDKGMYRKNMLGVFAGSTLIVYLLLLLIFF